MLHWAVETQELVNMRLGETVVVDECKLFRILEQCKGSITDEVDRCFVPSDVQQHHECHQLFGGHLFARFFGCD